MKLKAWLKKNKVSQTEFAKLLGTDQGHVSTLVNGKVSPTVRTIANVANITNWQVGYQDWADQAKRSTAIAAEAQKVRRARYQKRKSA